MVRPPITDPHHEAAADAGAAPGQDPPAQRANESEADGGDRRGIIALFRPAPGEGLDTWVLGWAGLSALGGLVLALALLCFRTPSADVFVEVWSDGILLATSPTDTLDLVDWVPRRGSQDLEGAPFHGIELGSTTLGSVYQALAGAPLPDSDLGYRDRTGSVVRTFAMWGHCLLRIERPTADQLAVWVRGRSTDERGCSLHAELELESPGWDEPPAFFEVGPRELGPDRAAILRFVPEPAQLPLRVERFDVRALGFHAGVFDGPAHLVYGGVVRLPDLEDDGDEQVYMNDRPLGRGHPIHLGDAIELGRVRAAQMLQLEIGDTVHARFRGNASAPSIGGSPLKPSILQHLNQNNAVLWIAAFVVGGVGVVLSVIEAAR